MMEAAYLYPQFAGTCHASPRGHTFNVNNLRIQILDDTGEQSLQVIVQHDYSTFLMLEEEGDKEDDWFVDWVESQFFDNGIPLALEWMEKDVQTQDLAVFSAMPHPSVTMNQLLDAAIKKGVLETK
jgi:hypothetical protein